MPRPDTQQSEMPIILSALKRAFRTRGITYRDVARALDISLTSVKRYMSGSMIAAQDLERLCRVAGFRLSELIELARKEQEREGELLTEEQEHALLGDQALAFILFLLLRGWSAAEIKARFAVSEARLVSFLARLDRLRLIDLLPENKVRVLAPSRIRWRSHNGIRRSTYEFLKEEFAKSRFDDPSLVWRHELLQLTPAQVDQLTAQFEELMRTAREMSTSGSRLPRLETAWFGVRTALQPIRLALQSEPDGPIYSRLAGPM